MASRIKVRIEPPYDVGFPWKLIVGDVESVISGETARYLSQDIPISHLPNQTATRDPFQESDLEGIKLSKKARKLLTGS